MAIGPGFVPAQLPTGQEYFKLPFNELLAGLSAKQKQFDTAEDEKNKVLEELLKVNPYFQPHKDYLNKYSTDLYSNIDNLTNQYQGDISKALPEIRKIARKVNQDLTYGDLATINASTKGAQEYLKQKQELSDKGAYEAMYDIGLTSGKGFTELSQLPYEQAIQDGKLKGFNYTGIHTKADERKESSDIFSPIKADAISNKWLDEKTNFAKSSESEGIIREKIYAAAGDNYSALSPNFRKELDFRVDNLSEDLVLSEAANYYKGYFGNRKDKDGKTFLWEKELNEDLKTQDINFFKETAKKNYLAKLGEKYTFSKESTSKLPDVDYMRFKKEKADADRLIQVPILPTPNPNQSSPFNIGKTIYLDKKDNKLKVKGEKEKTQQVISNIELTQPYQFIMNVKNKVGDGWLGKIITAIPQLGTNIMKGAVNFIGHIFEDDKELETTNTDYQRLNTNLRNRGIINNSINKGSSKEKEIVAEFINNRANGSVNAIADFRIDPKFKAEFNNIFNGDAKGEALFNTPGNSTFMKFTGTNEEGKTEVISGASLYEKHKGKPVSYAGSINDINSPFEYGSTVILVTDESDTKAPIKQYLMQPDLTTRQSSQYFQNGILRARQGIDVNEFELPASNELGLPAGKYKSEIEINSNGEEVFKVTFPGNKTGTYTTKINPQTNQQELILIK